MYDYFLHFLADIIPLSKACLEVFISMSMFPTFFFFCLLDEQAPKRAMRSHGDTDCGSDGEADRAEGEEEEEGGYMSGAESDSGLVDTRQSMNLVVRNLQVMNDDAVCEGDEG